MEFEMLFNTSEIGIHQVQDFKTKSWEKLCKSATLGAILCLHNDTSRIFKSEAIQIHYKGLMAETIKVAIADGAAIASSFSEDIPIKILNYPETKGSSMLTDLRQGKTLELKAKNGIISKLGKHYHIDTPLNDFIVNKLSIKKTNLGKL
jgi:2-dehydropantoate 2-reductase